MSSSSILLTTARAIGTAITLASVGIYLHRRGFVDAHGKRTLALITQQVTIPLFLCTKIINDGSFQIMSQAWILLLWPLYVVFAGTMVGYGVAIVTRTKHPKVVIAACALGNSSALPLTLLTVLDDNLKELTLGGMDPAVFLSLYMLLYPMLQWGYGSWLLGKDEDDGHEQRSIERVETEEDAGNEEEALVMESYLEEVTDPCHIRHTSLQQLEAGSNHDPLNVAATIDTWPEISLPLTCSKPHPSSSLASIQNFIRELASRCCQPPVVGSLVGIVIALLPPVRALFIHNTPNQATAPLSFVFKGLHTVGSAAVPISMIILGCNLSSSMSCQRTKSSSIRLLSWPTLAGIVIGKLLMQPAIGIASVVFLKNFLPVREENAPALYLVLIMVFLTPTANNVMVMVELFGTNASTKESIALVIALQYAVAPFVLSLTVSIAIAVATGTT